MSVVAVLLAAVSPPASAQRPDSLVIGSRLRVFRHTAPGRVTGILVAGDSNSLVLSSRWRPLTRYPYAEIRRIAVGHRETRPGGAARGAKRGLLLGAGVGLVATGISAVYEHNVHSEALISGTMIIGLYSVAFIGAAAGVGAIIGSTDRMRWEPVWPR